MKRFAAFLFAFALVPAFAADPPTRVGRLAVIEGEALAYTDPDTGWESAAANTHLTSENSVWTEPRSRAEVRVGSIALRLEETTQLDIARLEDFELRAHLARGSLAVRVRHFEKGESISITTPEARFQVRGNGRFRIDADAGRGESRLTVFAGSARLEASGGAVIVDTGRAVMVRGGERPTYEFEPAVTTGIDEWALARDERLVERQASRYVSPRMTGWEDLDSYGDWRDEPEYGTVWYPSRVDVGWAPYRYGRWAYVRPWGWTWVDDAPWGYAPFHYGRWVHVRNRWGWYPGRYDPRPVWAPALVGWVGGSGWSLTVNSGPVGVVGWYPLSPWERYDPWYRVAPTYVTHVNRVVIVDRRPPPNAVHYREHATVATREVFGSRRPVRESMAQVPREVIAQQPVVSGSTVLPATNIARPRPGHGFPGGAMPVAPATPGSPVGARPGSPLPPPAAPNVIAPAPGRPAPVMPPPVVPAPQPGTAQPPAPGTSPRPVFTPRPMPAEPSRPGEPVRPVEPSRPAEPSRPVIAPPPPSPGAPNAVAPSPNRVGPRPEPQYAPPVQPPKPVDAQRPAEAAAPVNRQPRGAPPEGARPRPAEAPREVAREAPRESRPPPRPEQAPRETRPAPRPEQAPAARPAEKPAQQNRPAKEEKPAKESGQKER